MSFPRKCHPHYCPFDSPACQERCECNKIKPNCISVTAQEAMNISRMKAESTQLVRQRGHSTRERVFGMPYDPRRDLDLPTIGDDIIQTYLRHNIDSMESRTLKQHASDRCCRVTCECALGPDCKCRKMFTKGTQEAKDPCQKKYITD